MTGSWVILEGSALTRNSVTLGRKERNCRQRQGASFLVAFTELNVVWNWAIQSNTARPSLLAQCDRFCFVYINTILLALIRYVVAATEGDMPASMPMAQPALKVH